MSDLAIIVPTVGKLLNIKWLESNSLTYHIIVVCDSGFDFDHPEITTIKSPKNGFSGSVNIGIRTAQKQGYRYALILNDDAFPLDDCIPILISEANGEDKVLSPIIVENERDIYGYRRSFFGRFGPTKSISTVNYLSAVCMLVPTWARFDEGYVHGFEDFELCRRLERSGIENAVVENARCRHVGGASIDRTSPQAQFASAYGQIRFEGLRKFPVVIALQFGQVLKEGFCLRRASAIASAMFRYGCERATAMASPKVGSNNAR